MKLRVAQKIAKNVERGCYTEQQLQACTIRIGKTKEMKSAEKLWDEMMDHIKKHNLICKSRLRLIGESVCDSCKLTLGATNG